jgi:hypothetical protein
MQGHHRVAACFAKGFRAVEQADDQIFPVFPAERGNHGVHE